MGRRISLPEAIASIVNKLVENEGARFPFLVVVVGLNGSIWYSRVELIEGERGESRTIVEKRAGGGFKFPVNILCIDGSGKGYLAVIGAAGATVH